jgi:hypothetical protein
MLNLFNNKQNRFNDRSPITSYVIEKNTKIQSNTETYLHDTTLNECSVIYYPFPSKEWSTNIYSYNTSYLKSLISSDALINKLVKSYFNMLEDKIKTLFKRRRYNKSRYSANKVYVSRAELNHTNRNIFITLYLYNKKRSFLEKCLIEVSTLMQFEKEIVNKKTIYIPNHKNRLLHILKNNFFIFKK